MNFDINTLSTLMQMMSSFKPRESEAPRTDADREAGGFDGSANTFGSNGFVNSANGSGNNGFGSSADFRNTSQSVFAMQNGLGTQVDFGSKPEKKQSAQSSNPMSSFFEMMSGKGGNDMMSGLMPMLMNMMGTKTAQVAQNANGNTNQNNNGSSAEKSFEEKLKEAKNAAEKEKNNTQLNEQTSKNAQENIENKQSNKVNFENRSHCGLKTRDRYSPVTFAGYTLISALNKLYTSKTLCR